MIRQAEFVDRNNFADWLNRTGRTGWAVEVGTHRAEFAALFLENWHGAGLFCVDPWSNPEGYEAQAAALDGGGADRGADHAIAARRLRPYGSRAQLLRETSLRAAKTFSDGRLDFVYVDGDHRYEAVVADLAAWWPKLRPGGVLAGHDVLSSPPYLAFETVQPAVLEFCALHGLDLYLVAELAAFQPWSFITIKPGGA